MKYNPNKRISLRTLVRLFNEWAITSDLHLVGMKFLMYVLDKTGLPEERKKGR